MGDVSSCVRYLYCLIILTCVVPEMVQEHNMHPKVPIVDIVIKVKNKYPLLQSCLESLQRHAPDISILRQRVLLIDDGSRSNPTTDYVHSMCKNKPNIFICLSTDPSQRGHTEAIVKGIDYGATLDQVSVSIVLLDADTVVTENWLINLYRGLFFNSNSNVSLVGPLSNAAGFQSVPLLRESSVRGGGWYTNPMPAGMNLDKLARHLSTTIMQLEDNQHIPLHGFCFMFKRDLISSIGHINVNIQSSGHGEKADFVHRAAQAGFESRVILNSYVYHARRPDAAEDKEAARATALRQDDIHDQRVSGPAITSVRNLVAEYYAAYQSKYAAINAPLSIIFIMNDMNVAGGTISIVSEAYQMLLYGVNVTLAVPPAGARGDAMKVVRKLLPGINSSMLQKLITLIPDSHSLTRVASSYNILVATYYRTMRAALSVVKRNPSVMLAYYVQDYEPWFTTSPFHATAIPTGFYAQDYETWFSSPVTLSTGAKYNLQEALNSYTANNKDLVIVAKTNWTASMILSNHGMHVTPVIGSMDHNIYYPNLTMLAHKLDVTFADGSFRIAAMIRPGTLRRNPTNTLDVLLRLAYTFPKKIHITIFGCTRLQLRTIMQELMQLTPRRKHRSWAVFRGEAISFLSIMKRRSDMADMFRSADVFLDLSWWQAFGRSGLEAMACGCVAVMPATGASKEICQNGVNCLSHDGNDVDGYFKAVVRILRDDQARYALIRNGIRWTWEYTTEAAAVSIATVLKTAYLQRAQ